MGFRVRNRYHSGIHLQQDIICRLNLLAISYLRGEKVIYFKKIEIVRNYG